MDVLSSGPDPRGPAPRRGRPRPVAARLAGLARLRSRPPARWALAALLVLVALGALAVLRSGAGPAGDPAAGPVAGGLADRPVPDRTGPGAGPRGPYDRLPGRVPIPPPTHAGWFVHGTLPPTGAPGRPAAERAAQLVLGRFCARPDRYTLTHAPRPDWLRVDVLVFGLDRSGDPPAVRLWLSWTGRSYAWAGTAIQLDTC